MHKTTTGSKTIGYYVTIACVTILLIVTLAVLAGAARMDDPSRRVWIPERQNGTTASTWRQVPAEVSERNVVNQTPVTSTVYLPLVYGPPPVVTKVVRGARAIEIYSAGDTWDEAKVGNYIQILTPPFESTAVVEDTPGSLLKFYVISRTIVYFDLGDVAGRTLAGDVTLTGRYGHCCGGAPDYDLLFRAAPVEPPTAEFWDAFETWPLLGTLPDESYDPYITQTVTLEGVVPIGARLPTTLAIGVQTSEPRLSPPQQLAAEFTFTRLELQIPVQEH